MSLKVATQTIALKDGRTISIETGKLAKQADGSILLRMGDTVLMATVVSNKKLREGIDFFPLSVDDSKDLNLLISNSKLPSLLTDV